MTDLIYLQQGAGEIHEINNSKGRVETHPGIPRRLPVYNNLPPLLTRPDQGRGDRSLVFFPRGAP